MNFSGTIRHPVIREWLWILVALWLIAYLVARGDWLERIDRTIYDSAMHLLQRPAQQDIVIVGIDESSLKQIGRWPWKRSIHATLLNRLTDAGAKVVVLDIILSEPDRANPAGDKVMADAVRRNGRVILPLVSDVFEGRPSGESLPIPEIADAAASVAQISLQLDLDGVLRQVPLRAGFGSARHDTFAVSTLRRIEPGAWAAKADLPGEANPKRIAFSRDWVSDHFYFIPFAGPPGHFRTVPYIDVLRGDVAPGELSGKIVLVGATASSLTDQYPTPAGGASAMAGIEVHANVLQGLREGIDIHATSRAQQVALALLLIFILMLSYLWLTPRMSLLVTIALAAAAVTGSAAAFRLIHVFWSPSIVLLAMATAYPLWSWRKLEATQRFLDEELARLEKEPTIVPADTAAAIAPGPSARTFVPDVIENRIAAVKSAAQRLRSLNRLIADSLESLPESALVTNPDGRILLANSSADRLFYARRTSVDVKRDRAPDRPLEGRDILELLANFSTPTVADWRAAWIDAYEETRPVTYEVMGPREREYLLQIAPLFSVRGPQTGSIVTIVDISPLRETERSRDEALRFLSHDMRSPQASILTLLEMHADDAQSITVPVLTERIGRYARRTLNLADDFLRLARAERVKPDDFESLDLVELMQDAVDQAWVSASARNIHIEPCAADTEALVRGDRDLLTRALANLLSNAIKYSPAGTRITCQVSDLGDHWAAEVTDQGYGIAESDMPRLFTRFARLRTEGQPAESGIGLGLVFVKTVAERHGGSVGVHSETVDGAAHARGTRFSLRLPKAGA